MSWGRLEGDVLQRWPDLSRALEAMIWSLDFILHDLPASDSQGLE